MTEVAFHFNVPDRLAYACRVIRKAQNQGKRLVVLADEPSAQQLDRLLWTFSAREFIAHCRLPADDGVVAASPVFKASYSGLFKEFWDVTEPDVMLAMPVVVAATGGSDRHALVPDTDMRSLFAFLRAIVAPTSIMAAGGDWASTGLADREKRAGRELGAFILSGVRRAVLDAAGKGYRRSFATATMDESASAASTALPDFDSSLMRLAAGGIGGD